LAISQNYMLYVHIQLKIMVTTHYIVVVFINYLNIIIEKLYKFVSFN